MALGLLDRPVRTDPAAPARRRPPPDREYERRRQRDGARALLERARALVAAGWVQDAFYVVRDRRGRERPVSPFGLLLVSRGEVVGACLVGAVSHAASGVDRRDRRADAALAVDTVWAALVGAVPPADVGHPADLGHPAERAARVRELARWNDEPQRSRADVLDLLDRALAR